MTALGLAIHTYAYRVLMQVNGSRRSMPDMAHREPAGHANSK